MRTCSGQVHTNQDDDHRQGFIRPRGHGVAHSTYGRDDKLLSITYVNAEHPTPNVTFSYIDPATGAPDAHGRLRQSGRSGGSSATMMVTAPNP